MNSSDHERLIDNLDTALLKLGIRVEPLVIENLAGILANVMSAPSRTYHNLDHVFSLVDKESPIQTLAALFHDLVYYQVDRGFPPEIHDLLKPYVVKENQELRLAEDLQDGDHQFQILLEIFGLNPGRTLSPTDGLNEFLSSLVAVKKLSGLVPEADLFGILLCIEGSIPFRESALTGEDYFNILERRVLEFSAHWGLGLSLDGIKEFLKQAVTFANRDVQGFAANNVADYLENSWKLVPELDASCRGIVNYSAREYRRALLVLEESISRVDPERVFHQYRGEPSDAAYHWMAKQAKENISTSLEYLQLKLVLLAVLEALADQPGDDLPLLLFAGGDAGTGSGSPGNMAFLTRQTLPDWIDPASDLYRLLADSHTCRLSFDQHTAPLALFIWESIAPDQFQQVLMKAREMLSGGYPASKFLELIPREVLASLASAYPDVVNKRRG